MAAALAQGLQARRRQRRSTGSARKRRYAHHRFDRKKLVKMQCLLFLACCAFAMLAPGTGNALLEGADAVMGAEANPLRWRVLADAGESADTDNGTGVDDVDVVEEEGSLYPEDLFTMEQKNRGAILLHIFAIFYTFIGLAIVCDEYFEPALAAICENLHLREDVAGATFMAAGGSAPELFSSIMGVFVAKSDIGFGTIVGSATFNVLFVIAACAFATSGDLELSWWPLTRDCVFYCASILGLVIAVIDKQINTKESVALLLMYCVYITIMYNNAKLEIWMTRQVHISTQPRVGYQLKLQKMLNSDLFNYTMYALIVANVVIIILEATGEETDTTKLLNDVFSAIFISEMVLKMTALSFLGYWHDALNAFDGTLVVLILVELMLSSSSISGGLRALRVFRFLRMARALRILRLYYANIVIKTDAATQTRDSDWALLERTGDVHAGAFLERHDTERESLVDEARGEANGSGRKRKSAVVAPMPARMRSGNNSDSGNGSGKQDGARRPSVTMVKDIRNESDDDEVAAPGAAAAAADVEDEDEDDDDDEPTNPFEVPDEGRLALVMWAVSLPLSVGMFLSIPDCRRPMFKRLYFVTFAMCIVWIGALAYVMIWMAVLFGEFAKIPDPVMGLTLIAAGTSIPDLLSSLAVARKGLGDMAVSSSVGSNIFDILIGLPVPWFVATAVVFPGTTVPIKSDGLAIMTLSLFLMVAAVVAAIHYSNWKLTKKLGKGMMVLYGIFFIESLILEYTDL